MNVSFLQFGLWKVCIQIGSLCVYFFRRTETAVIKTAMISWEPPKTIYVPMVDFRWAKR